MKEWAVYISSYDGASDIWPAFFTILDRFYKNRSKDIYLVTNNKKIQHKGVSIINTGPEIDWFYRTLKSLNSIDSKYILFLLEDYFISKEVREEDIDFLVKKMDDENCCYCRLSKSCYVNYNRNIIKLSPKSEVPYLISLQPGIWNRSDLIELLNKINKQSPWDFENYLNQSDISLVIQKDVLYDGRDILGYKNGVLRGKWIRRTLKFYKHIGISIDTRKRGVLSIWAEVKYNIANYLSYKLSDRVKINIKLIANKVGFSYLR